MVGWTKRVCQRSRHRAVLACAGLLLGCASGGDSHLHAVAPYDAVTVEGAPFRHPSLLRAGVRRPAAYRIYIEGDGLPWRAPTETSADPTPRRPLALALMLEDPSADAYLGRPCYWGTAGEAPCEAYWWTHGRFSEPVVASMVAAARRLRASVGNEGCVELVGYSGGGTLALLMAARMPEVCLVFTVASPVDVDAWSDRLGYSRLAGSLSPAAGLPLPGVRQVHLRGGRDGNVAPGNGERWLRESGATVTVFETYDHVCCWEREWPRLRPPP